MDEKRKISGIREIIPTFVFSIMFLLGSFFFFWKAGFFEPKEIPSCSISNLELCDTEELCNSIDLYWWDNACHIVEKPPPVFSEYPDYDAIQGLNSQVVIENQVSWSPKGKIIGHERILQVKGQFSRIYLYAEVSVNNKPLTQYESLYIKANNQGGHIFRPRSLKIPPNTITRLLYAANNISYLPTIPYSETKIPLTTDWFELFKDGKLIKFNTFISSLKPATINKIVIYYDCIEGIDCKIELLEK